MTALKLDNIYHSFGTTDVVKGVSIAVEPGKLACLLGPSGCGKTTLLRIAAGLEEVQAGQVYINDQLVGDGKSGKHTPPEHRDVGLMFQDYALFPHLTIFENITYGITDRANKKDRMAWVDHAINVIGLSAVRDAYPHMLSGGQQQRAALIRALAPEPRILLLDEPFSGLDVTRRAQIREETLVLLKDTGVAAMMVTHDPEEAMFMADHILVMDEGVIVQAGTPLQTYFQPANAFVAALFGPVNRFESQVAKGIVETPIGDFETPYLDNETAVEVLIRPEGLKLLPGLEEESPEQLGRVLTARLLGRSSYILLELPARHGKPAHRIQARIPGIFLPTEGDVFRVEAGKQQTFIFPTG